MLSESNENTELTKEAQSEDSDELGSDAKPLCPKCLKPVDLNNYYCPYCGSDEPINPLAAYMPFVRLRYMYSVFGIMWRKLWDSQIGFFESFLFILLIVAFAPILLIVGTPIMALRLIKNRKLQKPHTILLLIGLAVIVIILLVSWAISI
jgi:hypothetical protein